MIDALPYTQEEMKNMLVSVNPDFTFEQLMEEGNTFSLADLANK